MDLEFSEEQKAVIGFLKNDRNEEEIVRVLGSPNMRLTFRQVLKSYASMPPKVRRKLQAKPGSQNGRRSRLEIFHSRNRGHLRICRRLLCCGNSSCPDSEAPIIQLLASNTGCDPRDSGGYYFLQGNSQGVREKRRKRDICAKRVGFSSKEHPFNGFCVFVIPLSFADARIQSPLAARDSWGKVIIKEVNLRALCRSYSEGYDIS